VQIGGSGAGRARRLVALPRADIVGLVGPVRTSSTDNFKGAQSAPGSAGPVILKRTTTRARLSTRKRSASRWRAPDRGTMTRRAPPAALSP